MEKLAKAHVPNVFHSFKAGLFIILTLSLQAMAIESANSLYQRAYEFEQQCFYKEALAVYEQLIKQFPADTLSGPDFAGFRVKYVALIESHADKATALAAEIKALASSRQQKPSQLYGTAGQLERKSLFSDAASMYNQILSDYPDSQEAGPDLAGFRAKYVALNTAPADKVANLVVDIKALASSRQQKTSQLYCTACQLVKKGLFDDAVSLYNQILTDYPDSQETKASQIERDAVEVFRNICSGNIEVARSITTAIKSKYANCKRELNGTLFAFGEAYYLAGLKNKKDVFFIESINIFKNDLEGQELNDDVKSGSAYMLGLNYQKLNDYVKAAQAFENSFNTNPNYIYADYCLFAKGYCYEKMIQQKTISADQANVVIIGQYSELIFKFPESVHRPYVESWLKKNISNAQSAE